MCPYLRVLGADSRGLELLREMKSRAALPVITKPTHGRNLTGKAGALYQACRRADDVWGLCLQRPLSAGWSWSAGAGAVKGLSGPATGWSGAVPRRGEKRA